MDPVSRQTLGALLGLGAVGVLLCTALALGVPWPTPEPTPTLAPATQTLAPTLAATVTTIPQVITPTVTNPPPVSTIAWTMTPDVPKTGTPTQVSKTPTVSPGAETPVVADKCRQGVITAHAAIPDVLATKPDRVCAGCVYYASVLCQDIGKDLSLQIGINKIVVRVVDCATWAVGAWPTKQGKPWLGELDIRDWPDLPLVPLEAELCEG